MPATPRHRWGLWTLIAATGMAMGLVPLVDRQWTLALGQMQMPRLEAWMNRSIFEGEGLGVNDPVIFALLAVIAIYYLANRSNPQSRWAKWQPQAGFVLVSAMVSAVLFVHGCKWAMGRARPDLVFDQGMAFSHWFAFGPHFITEGIYHGAFPSGHTSQMFILMGGAYVLSGDSSNNAALRLAGAIWGAVVLLASLAMGVTRCMTFSHWISDIVGSICFGMLMMHVLYHDILRVPDQQRALLNRGSAMPGTNGWEIILCIFTAIGVLGVTTAVLGVRALIRMESLWLMLLLPAGVGIGWIGWMRCARLVKTMWRAI